MSIEQADEQAAAPGPQRIRIVLVEAARSTAATGGLRRELAQQTRVGDALVKGLVRAQLALALRLAVVVAVGLGALPLLFVVAPGVASAKVFGVGLPWLLLGIGSFPFLFVVGWAYIQLAERNEQDFTDLVRRPER
jgi:hypothetical protein